MLIGIDHCFGNRAFLFLVNAPKKKEKKSSQLCAVAVAISYHLRRGVAPCRTFYFYTGPGIRYAHIPKIGNRALFLSGQVSTLPFFLFVLIVGSYWNAPTSAAGIFGTSSAAF